MELFFLKAQFLAIVFLCGSLIYPLGINASQCESALTKPTAYPREIDPAKTFDSLVQWVYYELILKKKAPGLVTGISGTDSLVAFLATAKAYEMAGKPDRAAGVHFAPSEDFLDNVPAASAHLWFQEEIIPWLRKITPKAQINTDTSIDFRRDGLRWGTLMEWSVTNSSMTRVMRPPQEQYWVVGTRNKTEEALFTYSNASNAASVQLLKHLWKSEILQISRYLGVPEKAIDKSCEVDCVCGRMRLPATHIPEVDALLMVREGALSSDYVEKNIPLILRKQLTAYIDSQILSAQFKDKIPYEPEDSFVHVGNVIDPMRVKNAKKEMAEGGTDPRALACVAPEVIAQRQANIASDMVNTVAPHREIFLPELLTLFNTPDLRSSQKRQMIQSIFSLNLSNDLEISELAKINSRIGNYGFSFPQWRFLTQRYGNQPALAEQFGMHPLTRDNDIRDASLELSNPNRDELGRGFVWQEGEWYVEYRRAYILIANRDAAIVIRNNSFYFGRDRLKNSVYFLLGPSTPGSLQGLTTAELDNSGQYVSWQNLLRERTEVSTEEKIKRVTRLLDYLDTFNMNINHWLRTAGTRGGAQALANFLDFKLSKFSPGDKPPLYLGIVDGDSPSWHPSSIIALTPELMVKFRVSLNLDEIVPGIKATSRFVMMNGTKGDLP